MVVRAIEGGSEWGVVASPFALAAGSWLGWRVWRRKFLLTDDRVIVHNVLSTLDVPRADVVAVRIVRNPAAEWAMALEIRGRPKLYRCRMVSPRIPTLVRSVESFRMLVVEIECRLTGSTRHTAPFERSRPIARWVTAMAVAVLLTLACTYLVLAWTVWDRETEQAMGLVVLVSGVTLGLLGPFRSGIRPSRPYRAGGAPVANPCAKLPQSERPTAPPTG